MISCSSSRCCQKFRNPDGSGHLGWAGNLILRCDNIGAAIMPVFSYKTGNFWIVQNAQTQVLVNSGLLVLWITVDPQFCQEGTPKLLDSSRVCVC